MGHTVRALLLIYDKVMMMMIILLMMMIVVALVVFVLTWPDADDRFDLPGKETGPWDWVCQINLSRPLKHLKSRGEKKECLHCVCVLKVDVIHQFFWSFTITQTLRKRPYLPSNLFWAQGNNQTFWRDNTVHNAPHVKLWYFDQQLKKTFVSN